MESFDVCILGGNEMGCGLLRSLTLAGFKSVLVEAQDTLMPQCMGSEVSLQALTPSEQNLIKRATETSSLTCERLNVPFVTLPTTASEYEIPTLVDPWLLSIACVSHAVGNGAQVKLNSEITGAILEGGLWTLDILNGSSFKASVVINCGNPSDATKSMFKLSTDETQPSTQPSTKVNYDYLIYGSGKEDVINKGNITRFSDSQWLCAWENTLGDLVVGCARPANAANEGCSWLAQEVETVLSTLNSKPLASYSTTCAQTPQSADIDDGMLQEHSDMFFSVRDACYSAFVSMTIGAQLVTLLNTSSKYQWSSTSSTSPPTAIPEDKVVLFSLPPLEDVCASFAERNDGHISLSSGTYKVTHPLTRFGLSTRPPFRPVADLAPLALLIDSIEESSPLYFLKAATVASVLKGGYTNCLYLVKVPNDQGGVDQWVVRKGAEGEEGDDPLLRVHRINRAAEHACVTAAASVGLTPVSHFDKVANLLAQEYISEPETFDASRVRECLEECVDLLKLLHCSLPCEAFERDPPFKFDVFETAKHYIQVIRGDNPLNDSSWSSLLPSDIDQVMSEGQRIYDALQVKSAEWSPVCCHNDLVVGNMVRGNLGTSQRKLYLIDFEYAACGDRCFDLANLCVNSDCSANDTMRVAERYLVDNSACMCTVDELFARIQLLKVLSDLREAMWSLAHGSTLGVLSDTEPPKAPGDESMPQSFYKDYFRRHLERFRCSVGMSGDHGTDELDKWVLRVTQA